MQISYQSFFCITFLAFVFSTPLEKKEKNKDLSSSNIDSSSLENKAVTSKKILINKNHESDYSETKKTKEGSKKITLHLERRKEHIGNEENGNKKSRKEKNLEKKKTNDDKNEKESKESKKEERKKEKPTKSRTRKKSSGHNFILNPDSILPIRRRLTNFNTKDTQEKIKNKLGRKENLFQGPKKRCKCKKTNKRKEIKLQNDDVSQISLEVDPTLKSKIISLLPTTTSSVLEKTSDLNPSTPTNYLTRRDNSGDDPKYLNGKKTRKKKKKKKKKCRRKKKKEIVPKAENEGIYIDK